MNIFDIIGPVMIGPSSSHTAGAARIGRVCYKILAEPAVKADIGLAGSFAQTGKGHGTDKALIAGILGMRPEDERIRESLEIAKEQGLEYSFHEVRLPRVHPNTAVVHLVGASGAQCTVQGASVGGGNILITKLNGMEAAFTGERDTFIVLHKDVPGTLASVASMVANFGINISGFRLGRQTKGGEAVMTIEVDGEADHDVIEVIKRVPNVISVLHMRAN